MGSTDNHLIIGQCLSGPHCPYVHDHRKVAICREFLKTGGCLRGPLCDLSHQATYERVPACLHFLRGNCSNPSCRYAHVRVNPSAQVCKVFTALGYCARGIHCEERHAFECPEYSRIGNCEDPMCRLPHVDRAGQLRQHDVVTRNLVEHDSDISSAEENPVGLEDDDVESDGLEDEVMVVAEGDQSHVLAHQDDFVQF